MCYCTGLIRKIHTYAGLLTFIHLVVFGVVGIWAVVQSKPGGAPQQPVVTELAFRVEPDSTDREVAEQVCSLLHLSLATPIQQAVIQHDAEGKLVLNFYHANGRDRVTVLESEQRIRVETTRNTVWRYLDTLHETTGVFRSGDSRMQLWAWLNEGAMWSLAVMMASGVALWLASRAGDRWAQIALAAGCGLFAALFWWIH